jgi:Protein of unknown function (DUF2865)
LISYVRGVQMRRLVPLMSWRVLTTLASLFGMTSTATAQQFDFFNQRPERRSFATAMPYGTDSGSLPGNTANYGRAPFPMFSEDQGRPRVYIYRKVHRQVPQGEQAAFCVRTCDGRYFPAAVVLGDNQSRAETCKNFCPASETRIFYGLTIDEATGENGESYAKLPNAFRYRKEMVEGCTCNGQDQVGLSTIPVEQDPTLRKGDIVALAQGLMMVSSRRESKSVMYNFTPAPKSIRALFEPKPRLALR